MIKLSPEKELEYLVKARIGKDSNRYDCIPDERLSGTILDLGASLGVNQLSGKNAKKFLLAVEENRYMGVEAFMPLIPLLPIVQCDIMEFIPSRQYDLILLMDVIEHIQFRDWFILIPKLKSWLNEKGMIIITTPYNESMTQYLDHQGYLSCHVVFNIVPKIIERFLPNSLYEKSFYPLVNRIMWKEPHENHIRAFLRFVKRLLTRHKHGRIKRRRKKLIVYWKKEISS